MQEEWISLFWAVCCEDRIAAMPTAFFSSCLDKKLQNKAREKSRIKMARMQSQDLTLPEAQWLPFCFRLVCVGFLSLAAKIILANPTNAIYSKLKDSASCSYPHMAKMAFLYVLTSTAREKNKSACFNITRT